MSYCRWIDGDLYIYHSIPREDGTEVGLVCCGCRLNEEGRSFSTLSRAAMLEHIDEHRKAGHEVQEYAADALRDEIEYAGDAATGEALS